MECTSCTNAVTWTDSNGYYVGKMVLPTDMLRILSVKAEDWNRPAEIISESDDAYKYQNCKDVSQGKSRATDCGYRAYG